MDEKTVYTQRVEGFRLEAGHDAPEEKVLILLGSTEDEIVGRYTMPEDLWAAIQQDAREFAPA